MIRTVNATLSPSDIKPEAVAILGVFEHLLADLVPKGSDQGAFRHDEITMAVIGEARICPERLVYDPSSNEQ